MIFFVAKLPSKNINSTEYIPGVNFSILIFSVWIVFIINLPKTSKILNLDIDLSDFTLIFEEVGLGYNAKRNGKLWSGEFNDVSTIYTSKASKKYDPSKAPVIIWSRTFSVKSGTTYSNR